MSRGDEDMAALFLIMLVLAMICGGFVGYALGVQDTRAELKGGSK